MSIDDDAADFGSLRICRLGIPALAAEKMIWCVSARPNGFGWWGWLLQLVDWTDGRIAVTDSDKDEIWAMVADGTPIDIEQ
ncbi:hypothetical protein FJ970_26460 [Mesorhizobium sp. B2-1-8]|uniref:hypothetical protein n=1 Tax=Mesorhizobium sp. B2-1-8 TaxID=2589967 RepID=UPI00112D3BE2|nr:hypothetical protein [Mesorhizobium sp. B2-1-8]UCI22611.1 hypothetical protein FJ970_26460 [Mesorhizobium sp. B2-1-8]